MFKVLFLILFLMSSFVFSQTPMDSKSKARMIYKFGFINIEDFEARLAAFLTEIRNEPSAQGYIINYGSAKEVSRNESIIRNYYSRLETMDIRILIVSGGFRASQTTELWVVPDKADFPSATPEKEIKAKKFDEFGNLNDSELKARLNKYFIQSQKTSDATSYIINYGKAKDVAKREKLIRDGINFRCDFGCPRIVIVNGGESEELRTVFWIVPYGAEPPTP